MLLDCPLIIFHCHSICDHTTLFYQNIYEKTDRMLPGDPIVCHLEGCVTKFSAHPRLNRTIQRTEVFSKQQSSSLSGKDSLEGKETNSHFSSVPLILLDSLFYLFPVCKYIHNGLWLLHCPACLFYVLPQCSLFSSLLASAPLVKMHLFNSIRCSSWFVSLLVLWDLAKSSDVLKPNPVQL